LSDISEFVSEVGVGVAVQGVLCVFSYTLAIETSRDFGLIRESFSLSNFSIGDLAVTLFVLSGTFFLCGILALGGSVIAIKLSVKRVRQKSYIRLIRNLARWEFILGIISLFIGIEIYFGLLIKSPAIFSLVIVVVITLLIIGIEDKSELKKSKKRKK